MTRIDTKKFLFFGIKSDIDTFFQKAQDAGVIHFSGTGKLSATQLSERARKLVQAHKVLRRMIPGPQVEPETLSDAYLFSDQILLLQDELIALQEKKRKTRLEIARISVFGDFSLEDIEKIAKTTGREIQFYYAKTALFEPQTLPEEYIYITKDHGLDYFCSIGKDVAPLPKMVKMEFKKSLSTLKEDLASIETMMGQVKLKLKSYVKYDQFLHHALLHTIDEDVLIEARSATYSAAEGALFVIEGWVPQNKEATMYDLVKDLSVDVEEIAPEDNEMPPTYLENEGTALIGEDLVHIYDTPSNQDRDPSLWVLFSFALFFAMIIGDAGYGIIFFISALYFNWKMAKKSLSGKRAFSLAYILFGSCILWGALTHSFFGIEPGIDNPIRKTSLLQYLANQKASYHMSQKDETYQYWAKKYPDVVQQVTVDDFFKSGVKNSEDSPTYEILDKFTDQIRIELALLIGVLHITLSLLRYADKNYAAIGWAVFLLGGYLYIPEYLGGSSFVQYLLGISHKTAEIEGIWFMAGGFVFACVISLFQNGLFGLLEPTNVIQIFADVLSYLRLYALALAGAIIATIVNEMAGQTNWLFAALLLIFGHGLNMALSIMGGVIHGLRLNFIEWYHYCFEGGGKLFRPLTKLEKKILKLGV